MAVVARLILVLLLVMQSLPGVAVARCAQMTPGTEVVETEAVIAAACQCCSVEAEDDASCVNSDTVTACKCGEPRPEPKAPASDPNTERVQLVFAVLPAVLSFTVDRVDQPRRPVSRFGLMPKLPANSIQSVLCVWIM